VGASNRPVPLRAVHGAVFLLAMLAGSLVAQSRPEEPALELGIDAAYRVSIPDTGDRLSAIEAPLGRIRFGTYLRSTILMELAGGLAYAKEGDRSSSSARAEVAFSFHVGSDATRTRPYLVAGAGGRWATSDGVTNNQWLAGGGLGLKVPLGGAVGLRLEAAYARAFETDVLSAAHELSGLLGLSFYTY